jgi:general secretion pathway protein L
MATNAEALSGRPRPAWRARLSSFWRWWSGELRALVPERFAALGGVARVPRVALRDGELALVDSRGGTPPAAVAMEVLDASSQRSALRQLLESVGETRGRVRLCLQREEALVRRVTLPAATEENLEQVLGFEMDRLTPFRADDVYFDHRIVGRDAGAGQITAQLAVARRELVDSKAERLRAWGASVQGVNVVEDAGAATPLDLLPRELRGQRDVGTTRFLVPGLAALVLALLVVALLYPVYRKREAVVELLPLVAKAKQDAEATDVIRGALEKQVTDYNFLVGRRQGSWPALAILEDVSRILPDNTWVNQMDVKTTGKAREVQVTGETASASKLIELFEQSTVLQNATPKGAVTRGSMPNMERFMIVAETRARTVPAARPLLEVAQALPSLPPPAMAPVAPPPAENEPAASAPPANGAPDNAPPAKAPAPAKPVPPKNVPALRGK